MQFSSDSPQLIGYGVKWISNFNVLLQGPGTQLERQFWAIKMKLREPFHRQLFSYAENLFYELLSNIHRINCPTPVGCTKIRPLTCCVISLAQYIIR